MQNGLEGGAAYLPHGGVSAPREQGLLGGGCGVLALNEGHGDTPRRPLLCLCRSRRAVEERDTDARAYRAGTIA